MSAGIDSFNLQLDQPQIVRNMSSAMDELFVSELTRLYSDQGNVFIRQRYGMMKKAIDMISSFSNEKQLVYSQSSEQVGKFDLMSHTILQPLTKVFISEFEQ